MTSIGSENKEVAKAPSPRRLMRVLTVFATVFVWPVLASSLMEVDFFNGDELDDHLFKAFFYLLITQWTVIWTWRAWSQPNGKSDRVVLMACLFGLMSMIWSFFFELTPEPWDMIVVFALLLFSFPGFVWWFRRLEQSWTADGDMLSLPEEHTWPADRHFLHAYCVVVFFSLSFIVYSLLREGVSDITQMVCSLLIPTCASWATYRVGRKRLARQLPAPEVTQKQSA